MKGADLVMPIRPPVQPNYWEMARKARDSIQFNIRDPAWAEYIGISLKEKAA
jgi:hypothetical protein